MDWDVPQGTPLLSLVTGVCEFAGTQFDVGNWIRIRSDSGYAVDYYHMQFPTPIRALDRVQMGQQVGAVGSTGYSTGAHLHLQIIQTLSAVDPLPFLANAPALGGEADVEVVGLDQSETANVIQRFVLQAVDVVADNQGDGAYRIVTGFPDQKPDHDYIVLALRKA
jgi:hypothetical protein